MPNLKRPAEDDAPSKVTKKKKQSKYSAEDESLDTELGLNTLFQRMDNQLVADYLAQKTGRFGGDLSTVEISDITVSGKKGMTSPERKNMTADHKAQQTQYKILLVSRISEH